MSLASSSKAEDAWRARLNLPHYQVGEVARYAQISTATIVGWQTGGKAISAREFGTELSYLQLIEVAVVAAMRRGGITLKEIRATRAFMQNQFKSEHPFAEYRFKSDGKSLWLSDRDIPGIGRKRGHLIRTGQQGQLAWDTIIGRLKEFDYERKGIVIKWHVAGEGSPVIIDPRLSYGAPSVRGVPTWILKGRWVAGEKLNEIAGDFGLKESAVLDALKFEGIDTSASRPHKWLN